MRKYGSNRPSATLYVRRRTTRKRKPSFFLKFLLMLLVAGAIAWGVFAGGRYGYYLIKNAQITDWHVKSVSVRGVDGTIEKQIFEKISALQTQPFSFSDAEKLRKELVQAYPMLRNVSVSRGLLTGKLKVSATPREPVARFLLPDRSYKFIDKDSVVYADPNGPRQIAQVELVGEVPAKLQPSFVELVQSVLKLKKSLPFEALQFNLQENTVTMRLPDQSIVRFGTAEHLKSKATRAAQIMDIAREKYQKPVTLNFEFFNQGKVFLTLYAH